MKTAVGGWITVVLVAVVVTSALAEVNEVRWGGPGYDPAQASQDGSSRFVARPQQQDPSMVEILVDAEITVKGTSIMELAPKRGAVLRSDLCWKVMRHLTSPWACSFPREDLLKQDGAGHLRVKDKKGRVLLQDKIDFNSVKNALSPKR